MFYIALFVFLESLMDFSIASSPGPSQSSSSISTAQSTPEFYTDFVNGTSGKLKMNTEDQDRRCDFAIRLNTLVEAGDLTGYYAKVKREMDGEERMCFFTTDSIAQQARFTAQLNRSFGTGGGFTYSFSDQELVKFFQFVKRSQSSPIQIKKATTVVGLQPKSSYWVIGEDKHFNQDGNIVPTDTSPYVWSFECLAARCDKVSPHELIPELHFGSAECLKDLIDSLKQTMRHNYMSALLVVGGSIMGCHFRRVINLFGGFSVLLAYGPTETGKSTSLRAALFLSGGHRAAFYSKGSTAYMMERAALSCLPFAIDDPNMGSHSGRKQLDIPELVVDLYNGAKTANLRSGALLPCSAPIIATNTLPKDDPRTQSRTINVHFKNPPVSPRDSEEQKARDKFDEALRRGDYSSCMGWIISLGQKLESNVSEVRKINQELLKIQAFAEHPRRTCGWSVLYYFTLQLLEKALPSNEVESAASDLKSYIISMVQGCDDSRPGPASDIQTITETMEDILTHISDKPLYEVLTHVRTGCKVAGMEVVAFCTEKITGLRNSKERIRVAINNSKHGSTIESKDFLQPGLTSTSISRQKNSVRSRCFTVNMCILSPSIKQQLWKCTGSKTASCTNPQLTQQHAPEHLPAPQHIPAQSATPSHTPNSLPKHTPECLPGTSGTLEILPTSEQNTPERAPTPAYTPEPSPIHGHTPERLPASQNTQERLPSPVYTPEHLPVPGHTPEISPTSQHTQDRSPISPTVQLPTSQSSPTASIPSGLPQGPPVQTSTHCFPNCSPVQVSTAQPSPQHSPDPQIKRKHPPRPHRRLRKRNVQQIKPQQKHEQMSATKQQEDCLPPPSKRPTTRSNSNMRNWSTKY